MIIPSKLSNTCISDIVFVLLILVPKTFIKGLPYHAIAFLFDQLAPNDLAKKEKKKKEKTSSWTFDLKLGLFQTIIIY